MKYNCSVAYTDKVLEKFICDSNIFNGAFTKMQIIELLPEYSTTCVLTYYQGYYGKIYSVIMIVLVLILIFKILYDIGKINFNYKVVIVSCMCLLLSIMIINILQNLAIIPFVSYSTFFPFYSNKSELIILSYSLIGIALNVYEAEVIR